jgi:acetate kinase
MATRSGSVDPGLLLWLLEHTGLGKHEMAHALEHDSGLLALAGSADMRAVLAAVEQDDPRAKVALAVYEHHLRAGIAAMAAAMGGIDALAFCGGVGEHAAAVRAAAAAGLGFLGVSIDPRRNADPSGDRDVSADGSAVHTLVVAAREDLEIARQVHALLRGDSPRERRRSRQPITRGDRS